MRNQPATSRDSLHLSAAEAQERLGVSRDTIRRLIKSGQLKAIKTGSSRNSQFRISEDDFAEYIERQTVRSA